MLHGHPAVLDCAVFGIADERAGEVPVAAVQLDPDRPVDRRRAPAARGRLARHLQAAPPRRGGRRHPPPAVGQGAAPHAPRRVGAAAHRGGRADGRPPLPRAAGAPRLRRPGRRPTRRRAPSASSTTPSGPPSSTPPSPPRAGASCAPPTTTARRWASGVEVAIVAEELARGLADAAFLGPTLAAELRRRAGAPPAAGRRDGPAAVRPVGRSPRRRSTARSPSTPPAPTSALVLVPSDGGHALAPVDARTGGAPHRPHPADGGPAPAPTPCAAGRPDRPPRPTTTSPRGRRSAWRSTCADLVGTMRGAVDLAAELRQASAGSTASPIGSFQAVQHLLADAFVAMEGSRSVALHAAWAVDALPPADALAAARAGQGVLRPGRPHRCARPPSRSTAASATPGSASPTCTSAGRCCRPTSSAASAPTSTGCSPTTGSEAPMDFGDSPDEAAFRARLRDVAARQQPGPAARRRPPTTTGRPGRLAPGALRRRLLRPCRGRRTSAARSCRPSTT